MAASKNNDGRPGGPLESETTAPRTRPSPPADRDEGAARPSRINIVHAETPLFESNTGRLSPVPRGGTPPRGSSALRDSSPGRSSSPSRPSSLPLQTRGGRVAAVVMALLAALVVGILAVAVFDRGPGGHKTKIWQPFEQLSWSAVYDYFFPPGN